MTAANSSSISDGAAALVLTCRSVAEARGAGADCGDPRACHPRPGAGLVHHARRSARSRNCSKRPAGKWRTSICSRSTRRSPSSPWRRCASWASARQGQRQRRRLRLGHPIGCLRRADHRHAAVGAEGARLSAASPPLHRRRRGDGHRHRDGVGRRAISMLLSEEQIMIRDMARRFAGGAPQAVLAEWDATKTFPRGRSRKWASWGSWACWSPKRWVAR